MPQCGGTAKSTGQRCRITRGVDSDGRCKYHPLKQKTTCTGFAETKGRRCHIWWGLDADGRCQLHRLMGRASQPVMSPPRLKPCDRDAGASETKATHLATKASSMTRAAVSDDSDKAKTGVMFCRGTRKDDGKPCGIYWQLDKEGYCKYHSPSALQCRGMAKSTGQRCRIKWDLDGDVLCKYHVNQTVRCHGTTEIRGRCRSTSNIDRFGYCPAHSKQGEGVTMATTVKKEKAIYA